MAKEAQRSSPSHTPEVIQYTNIGSIKKTKGFIRCIFINKNLNTRRLLLIFNAPLYIVKKVNICADLSVYMMLTKRKGPQGFLTDRYSGSKVTNQTNFHPFRSSMRKIHDKYYKSLQDKTSTIVRIEPTSSDFIFAINKEELERALSIFPLKYTKGIKAILVPSGTKKEIKVVKKQLWYGAYWDSCIFLFPFPKILMTQSYRKSPPKFFLQEYKKAGATITEENGLTTILFNKKALKQFYLCDVLLHEIGHHADLNLNRNNKKKTEGFAEWFAREHREKLLSFISEF